MRATFAYTTARILIFVVSLIVLYLVGARQLLLIGLALVLSGIISFVLLSRPRDAQSAPLARTVTPVRGRRDAGARAEDDD